MPSTLESAQTLQEALARRDAILHAIGFAARSFLGVGDFGQSMQTVLARLGRATHVSRTYVFQNHTGPAGDLRTGYRYEWCAPGIESHLGDGALVDTGFEDAGFGRWRRILERGEVLSGDVDTFPPKERQILAPQGIRSLVVVPILDGPRWWGFMGFDDCRTGRRWASAEIEALLAAAGVLGAALQRQETERVLAEREVQLRQAQKMEAVGRLAGGIAHDFNNLLTVIHGQAELILLQAAGDADLIESVHHLEEAARRGSDLTRQLLSFSRRRPVHLQTVSLNELIAALEDLLVRLLGDGIRVQLELHAAPDRVHADPTQLEQILLNLAINARDAMKEGGQLLVATERRDAPAQAPDAPACPYLVLRVRDTGEGMDEATRARIFEPFFTTKSPDEGTGLGLATVYAIVQQTNGRIRVESAPGRGTCFEILLPAES